jgi:hypothetical protein
MVLATDFQKQNSGKVNKTPQAWLAGPILQALFDYPKTLEALCLFIQLFVLAGFSPPCVVSHCIDFNLGVILYSLRSTMKILETINKTQLVPVSLQAVNYKTPL